MLCISRCQALKRPLKWFAKPLSQSIVRPLSQSSTLFLRPTTRFLREEQPAPAFKEKVGPLEFSDTFYEKVGKPRIRNQVLVSRRCLIMSSPQFVSLNKFSEVRSRWVMSGHHYRCN